MQHLVSIDDLSESDIQILFYRIEDIKNSPQRLKYHLNDKILANLFYEPSTRTSSSFAAAMFKLGGNVISINDVNYSSVSKGENLEDTIKTMGLYADMIALRSQNAGDAQKAAEVSEVPIINAGDGNGEHPTQTLLDLYTIWESFKKIDNLTITMMGDLKNGRTIHSLLHSLKHFNVKFSGVNVLEDPEIREGIKKYSDWPTIPQLYIKGEFVGGCDIVKEMFEKGDLQKKLKEKNISYKEN